MSAATPLSNRNKAEIASACERLVHPRIVDGGERQRQQRLLAVVLLGPFLLAAAAAQVSAMVLGTSSTVALVCGILCIGWLMALLVASTGKRNVAGPLALAFGALMLGGVVAAAGGLASPLTVMFVALPIEAVWVGRTRRSIMAGLAAAVGAALLTFGLADILVTGVGQPAASAWLWLAPLVYGASLWSRIGGVIPVADADEPNYIFPQLERVIGAVILRADEAGDIVSASEQAHDLFGLPGDVLLGKGLLDRIHIGDRVSYLSALADLRRGAARRTVSLRLRTAAPASGPAIYARFSAELVGDGPTRSVTMILRDDADHAALEAALSEQTDRAQQSELMRTRMLASVSHELRTPLNAILGFSDGLANEMFGSFRDERQREYVRLIHDAGGHLLSVVNALLDLSRVQSGALEPQPECFNFQDAVHLSASMVEEQARARDVALDTMVGDGVGEVCCDRRMVQQILINLLSNAVKFTPCGGKVAITARRCGERLDFEIADTGIGMSQDDLARIGTPFMQVESDYTRQFDGAGLGLSLVKALVDLQRGGMSVESAPGAGTRVLISLPLIAPVAGAITKDDDTSEFKDDAFLKTA